MVFLDCVKLKKHTYCILPVVHNFLYYSQTLQRLTTYLCRFRLLSAGACYQCIDLSFTWPGKPIPPFKTCLRAQHMDMYGGWNSAPLTCSNVCIRTPICTSYTYSQLYAIIQLKYTIDKVSKILVPRDQIYFPRLRLGK